jgi:GMP synthase (glutamine-hydrolysing)
MKKTMLQLETLHLDDINATLLPVKTVGVQGDSRSYQYVVGLSGERNWKTLFALARAIPQVSATSIQVVTNNRSVTM